MKFLVIALFIAFLLRHEEDARIAFGANRYKGKADNIVGMKQRLLILHTVTARYCFEEKVIKYNPKDVGVLYCRN